MWRRNFKIFATIFHGGKTLVRQLIPLGRFPVQPKCVPLVVTYALPCEDQASSKLC